MDLSCLSCGAAVPLPEGGHASGAVCPKCGAAAAEHFMHQRFVRFEPLGNAAYVRSCDLARAGDRDAALAALEDALAGGMDLEIVDADPALGSLRSDPRWSPLLSRFRPR